jgi:CRISPR-associated protein Csb2
MSALVLHVRLHDGRYHGKGDWPPSPARLFQALVAGAGIGGPIGHADKEALEWLEQQKPPLVAAPLAWQVRRAVLLYVPNNDSDASGGDAAEMAKIRTAKFFRPYFFDAAVEFVYAWPLTGAPGDDEHARAICGLAERLYQLGRGVDMAWAWGEITDASALDDLIANHPGNVFRPSSGKSKIALSCPCRGSLKSLDDRHKAFGERFSYEKQDRSPVVTYRKPPKPHFRDTPYEGPFARWVYELRSPVEEGVFAPWPLTRIAALVIHLRDSVVARLKDKLPQNTALIERVLVGRKPDGTNDGPIEDRVRIIPLPSVGHVHADREIRRVLVEVPPTCPLHADDVAWAFSGLDVTDLETGEIMAVLTRTDDDGFLGHYGLEDSVHHRVWRTVTPAALPHIARRRRINPARKEGDIKAGSERVDEQARAGAAVLRALRHAGVRARAESIRLQREPFDAAGARVEPFAEGTRFEKERLWHVEVAFNTPVGGPLLIGDGRFLGLGLMAPSKDRAPGVHIFTIEGGLVGQPEPLELARALRRAVMARVQDTIGTNERLAPFFSGHAEDGTPVERSRSSHLSFAFDPDSRRLLVLAPHVVERRAPTHQELDHLRSLDAALEGFCTLRAGRAGMLSLSCAFIGDGDDPLLGCSRVWTTITPYVATRHVKVGAATEALAADVRVECRRLGLPQPMVKTSDVRAVRGLGLSGTLTVHFERRVAGPLLLGRTRYLGGGLFRRVDERERP